MPEPEETPKDETSEIQALRDALAAAEADAEKWKSLSRKNEQRASENAEKAQKTDEAIARAEKAEGKLADRDSKEAAQKLRDEVAKDKGFDDRKINAAALRGSTREELEAHADELLALVPEPPAAPSADGQGNVGDPIGEGEATLTPNDLLRAAHKK